MGICNPNHRFVHLFFDCVDNTAVVLHIWDLVLWVPPEQAYFLRQNLRRQLETARLAVLQLDGANYRDAVNEARAWIERYFDTDDRAVTAAIEQLDALAGERVRSNLPDLSASLEAVRTVMERRRAP